ncbi:hypothetical protein MAUB_04410 [Mycolicibacterium aubagnense]|uniref:Uncharacterized protein n=1 Tax=Mycolicibacterium aubagnense TaxID=319707 RepID=A0ABM7I7H9_9MYCO|nr:hypothetical protein MAUB_04410 [Mycolicibacterium aubagnense]
MNFDDLAVLDRDVGGEPAGTGPVDDSAAGDHQIEHIYSLIASATSVSGSTVTPLQTDGTGFFRLNPHGCG